MRGRTTFRAIRSTQSDSQALDACPALARSNRVKMGARDAGGGNRKRTKSAASIWRGRNRAERFRIPDFELRKGKLHEARTAQAHGTINRAVATPLPRKSAHPTNQ